MTPAEKDAIEQAVNQFLQSLVVILVLSWWLWWLVRKVGADRLFSWPQTPTQEAPKALTPPPPAEPAVMSREDRQTDSSPAAAGPEEAPALQVDRTRAGLVKALVAAGWSATEIRSTLRGDNVTISSEIAAARRAIEEGMLIVRDGQGERLISR